MRPWDARRAQRAGRRPAALRFQEQTRRRDRATGYGINTD